MGVLCTLVMIIVDPSTTYQSVLSRSWSLCGRLNMNTRMSTWQGVELVCQDSPELIYPMRILFGKFLVWLTLYFTWVLIQVRVGECIT